MKDLAERWEKESKSWAEIASKTRPVDPELSERSQTRSETYDICAQQLKKRIKEEKKSCQD